MADIGREDLIQAAIHGELARRADARDFYKGLRKKADADPDTALAMMGGRQPSPDIIRANIDESIGSRKEDGTMDHDSDPNAKDRYDRAQAALRHIDALLSSESFDRITPQAVKDSLTNYIVDNVLLQHPVFRTYLRGFGWPNVARGHAKVIAAEYLSDPKTRAAIQEAVRGARLSSESVGDTLSGAVQTLRALEAGEVTLRARKIALDAPGGEIAATQARKAEFAPGKSLAARIATLQTELSTRESRLKTTERTKTNAQTTLENLQRELSVVRGVLPPPRGGGALRAEADVVAAISLAETDVNTRESEYTTALQERDDTKNQLLALQEEKNNIDAIIAAKIKELGEVNGSLAEIAKQRAEVARLRAEKGKKEEEFVTELEEVFQKGFEATLLSRYGNLQDEAKKQAEERKQRNADNNDKKYEDRFMERYFKKVKGKTKIDGAKIETDYATLMSASTTETIAGNGYFLTGPEKVAVQVMREAGLSDADIAEKIKDKAWMTEQSERVAQEVLKQKFMATRGIKGLVDGRVRKFAKGDLEKLSRMPWAKEWLDHAMTSDASRKEMFEKAFGAGAVMDEGWWSRATEKLGGGKRGTLMLMMILMAVGIAGGASAGVILPVLGSLGISAASSVAGLVGGQGSVGAVAGGAAGVGAAGVGVARHRT